MRRKDRTRELLSRIENAKIVLNDENLNFIRGNNQGVQHAIADYVLLLNNDTEFTPCVLSSLFACMRNNEKCGAVGAKFRVAIG